MKKVLYWFKRFLVKNVLMIVLLFFLILSIFINIDIKDKLSKYDNEIYGTYMRKNEELNQSEYLVFEKNKFYHYIQFELLDKGNYKEIYDNVYYLKGNEKIDDFIIKGVMDNEEVIYFNNRKLSDIDIYLKISDVPTFINIKK